jgi:pimeloyl-ACP methyl ester carboxylesterase
VNPTDGFMKTIISLLVVSVLSLSVLAQENKSGAPPVGEQVSFESEDGLKVFADLYRSKAGNGAPLLLLFHQGGGDARGEYAPILPKLLPRDLNILAVDLRKGGDLFGLTNRTAEEAGEGKFTYCDAYKDVTAALEWARGAGMKGGAIAWGSSFSGALVLKLAAEQPDEISGVLAFSPASGAPMEGCRAESFATSVKAPTMILRPASELERESAQAQFKLFKGAGFETYVAQNGVHGSSMLVDSRVKGETADQWKAVERFLDAVLSPK